MANRAKTLLAQVKKGDFGLIDKGKKKPLGMKYQQELEDFTDDDRQKPKNHNA